MQKGRIVVALSGGVDSAVAAALLQQQGYRVEGVYLKYASETVDGLINTQVCTWRDDLDNVTAVGAHLNIPVRSLNVERLYDQRVVRYFLDEYQLGRTPNPDIACNRYVKFGLLLQWARRQGITAVATGHYARIERHHGSTKLLVGLDPTKDQSYFLSGISRGVLPFVHFPIGHLTKIEVRKLARRLGLPNAARPDSQGICFLGKVRIRDFLQSRISVKPGSIIAVSGQVLGTHAGLPYYTIGQRHGFGLGGGVPYYVVEKRNTSNELVVANQNDPALRRSGLVAAGLNWLSDNRPPRIIVCTASIRYHQTPVRAVVIRHPNESIFVHFDKPQIAVTPGQTIVFYDEDVVLGSAVIEKSLAPAYLPTSLPAHQSRHGGTVRGSALRKPERADTPSVSSGSASPS